MWPPVRRPNLEPLSPKEMLQEKSLSETEEGFPTAPAPGHADTSAGSPVLGVAGGSTTPLSSPQLPDPEQVRSVRPRVLPRCAFTPAASPARQRAAPPATTPAGIARKAHFSSLFFAFIFYCYHFIFLIRSRPPSVRRSVKGEPEHRKPRPAGPGEEFTGAFPPLNKTRLLCLCPCDVPGIPRNAQSAALDADPLSPRLILAPEFGRFRTSLPQQIFFFSLGKRKKIS